MPLLFVLAVALVAAACAASNVTAWAPGRCEGWDSRPVVCRAYLEACNTALYPRRPRSQAGVFLPHGANGTAALAAWERVYNTALLTLPAPCRHPFLAILCTRLFPPCFSPADPEGTHALPQLEGFPVTLCRHTCQQAVSACAELDMADALLPLLDCEGVAAPPNPAGSATFPPAQSPVVWWHNGTAAVEVACVRNLELPARISMPCARLWEFDCDQDRCLPTCDIITAYSHLQHSMYGYIRTIGATITIPLLLFSGIPWFCVVERRRYPQHAPGMLAFYFLVLAISQTMSLSSNIDDVICKDHAIRNRDNSTMCRIQSYFYLLGTCCTATWWIAININITVVVQMTKSLSAFPLPVAVGVHILTLVPFVALAIQGEIDGTMGGVNVVGICQLGSRSFKSWLPFTVATTSLVGVGLVTCLLCIGLLFYKKVYIFGPRGITEAVVEHRRIMLFQAIYFPIYLLPLVSSWYSVSRVDRYRDALNEYVACTAQNRPDCDSPDILSWPLLFTQSIVNVIVLPLVVFMTIGNVGWVRRFWYKLLVNPRTAFKIENDGTSGTPGSSGQRS
eukprot:CAMPEP_0177644148 /NCGR_PEP_ID=MMETSP0447-20121125/8527_1 /TAXON_ID=0 /ORGANISM="Stygamoeba regulata, Strain BSH-02190019" /LENGTH=563 /DNA_ID=CAMNT_0019146477 /DNA_START=210 /DNA_END=1897 /DNA_ORIENTATION=+